MSNISRRDFMKTAGVMTLAVAASAAFVGCDSAPSSGSSSSSETPATTTSIKTKNATVTLESVKLYDVSDSAERYVKIPETVTNNVFKETYSVKKRLMLCFLSVLPDDSTKNAKNLGDTFELKVTNAYQCPASIVDTQTKKETKDSAEVSQDFNVTSKLTEVSQTVFGTANKFDTTYGLVTADGKATTVTASLSQFKYDIGSANGKCQAVYAFIVEEKSKGTEYESATAAGYKTPTLHIATTDTTKMEVVAAEIPSSATTVAEKDHVITFKVTDVAYA